MREQKLGTMEDKFPAELRPNQAAYEVVLDDRSKIVFVPLRAGGVAIQSWRSRSNRDGHGYLLSASGLLTEQHVDVLVEKLRACCTGQAA